MPSFFNPKTTIYPLLLGALSLAAGSCSKGSPSAPTPTPTPTPTTPRSFVILSQIRYNSTPADLTQYGISRSQLHAPATLLNLLPNDPNTTGNPNLDYKVVDSTKIATQAQNDLSLNPNVPVVLDIEAWSFAAAQLPKTLADFTKVIRIFKRTNPTSPIGFYGAFPQTKYTWANVKNPADYQNWQNVNNSLAPVANLVQFFAPTLYTRDAIADSANWRLFALANLKEARRYNAKTPVYAYIQPQFATTAVFLPASYWQYQLESLYKMGYDGVIIWTSNKDSNGTYITFATATQQDWWATTLAFVKAKNIQAR